MTRGNQIISRRKWLGTLGSGAAFVSLTGCTGGDGGDGANGNGGVQWSTGGSQEGSPMNSWVEGMATVINENSNRLHVTPELAPGWQRSIVDISQSDIETSASWYHFVHHAQNDDVYFAEDGEIGPLENNVVGMTPGVHHGHWWFVTYADRDDLQTVADLDGGRVALNLRGESPTKWAEEVLEAAEIDVDYNYMDFVDAGNAIRNRNVDAAIVLATNGWALPPPTIEAFSAVDYKGLSIPTNVQDRAQEINPVMRFGEVRNEDLDEQGEFDTVESMFQVSGIMVREDQDEELVYDYVSSLLDNQSELDQYHPVLAEFGIGEGRNGFEGVVEDVELHPGAARYYDEQGIEYPGK